MEESVKESSAEENAEISVQETELQIISEKSTSCSICGKRGMQKSGFLYPRAHNSVT